MRKALIIVGTTIVAFTGAITPITNGVSKAHAEEHAEQQLVTFTDIQGHP